MRPYYSILVDSVREAWSSRILWVLFLISALLLLALSGFSLYERAAATIFENELWNPRELAQQLQRSSSATEPTATQRIWELLNSDERQNITRLLSKSAEPAEFVPVLKNSLNRLLAEPELIGNSQWPVKQLDNEGRELLASQPNELPANELARLNRLLLEVAFPQGLAPSRERELTASYFGMDIPTGSMPALLRRDYLIRGAVSSISTFFLGYLGLFAGLIVTSSVIPQTFEPGAIDLLLSKPVNRMGVYLCKFLGGCVFVLLNTSFLLGGLWLLVGIRHQVWMTSLIWCIPVFLFWFMVFYAVSALIGLIWRNAIVAVTVTIGLWGFCALLSFVKNVVIEGMILDPARYTRLVVSGEQLIATSDVGQVYQGHLTDSQWSEILVPDSSRQLRNAGGNSISAAPILVGNPAQVLLVQRSGRRMPFWLGQTQPLVYGLRSEAYRRQESNISPTGTNLLHYDRRQRVIAVGLNGISVLKGDLTAKPVEKPALFGFELPLPSSSPVEFQLLSTPQRWIAPLSASGNSKTDQIAVLQRQLLQVFEVDQAGKYREQAQLKLPGREFGVVAWCGELLLLGFEDGTIQVLRQSDLSEIPTARLHRKIPPRFIESSPAGNQAAVLFHDRQVWLFQAETATWQLAPVRGQGDLSAITWQDEKTLWSIDQGQRATAYAVNEQFAIQSELTPPSDWLQQTDRYLLRPLYLILPKIGETSNLVTALLTDEQTTIRPGQGQGLSIPRTPVDLVTPLVSHAIWVVCLLALGCIYIHRHDY